MSADRKVYQSVHGKALDTAAEWPKIAALMVNPERFRASDFRAFEVTLANNLVDRDGERFTKRALERLAETLVDKSKLNAHNWMGLGNGRFYYAAVERIPDSEVPKLARLSRGLEAKIAERDGGFWWLVARFYLFADDEQVRQIDAGIAKDMSVGFSGVNRIEVRGADLGLSGEGANIVFWTELDGDGLEALEASTVWLGAQVGAHVRKEAKNEREGQMEGKGVIRFRDYGIVEDLGAEWDAAAEVRGATVDDLMKMCAWYDDEKPDVKASYKLPHHRKSDYKAIWRGVAAAMGALFGARGGVDIPDDDRRGVYNHLARHYEQFEKEPPEFREYTEAELKELFGDIGSDSDGEEADKVIEVELLGRKVEVEVSEAGIVALAAKAAEVTEEMSAESAAAYTELENETKMLRDQLARAEEEFGKDFRLAREWKEEAEKRKRELIDEVMSLGVIIGALKNEEVKAKREVYEKMSVAEIEDRLSEYRALARKVPMRGTIETARVVSNYGFSEV